MATTKSNDAQPKGTKPLKFGQTNDEKTLRAGGVIFGELAPGLFQVLHPVEPIGPAAADGKTTATTRCMNAQNIAMDWPNKKLYGKVPIVG